MPMAPNEAAELARAGFSATDLVPAPGA
jgi:hypothetical protein